MTNATLTGSITWPPELRFTASGRAVCEFSIDLGKTQITCEAWEALAERIAARDLQIGRYIEVTGYYKWREWDDKDGHHHRVRRFTVLSGKPLSLEQGVLNILNRDDE